MEKIEQKMQAQMKNIENNLSQIKLGLEKGTGPIFVELVGTPKSGKTTLLNSFKNLFEKADIPFQTRRETAEYNPIENKNVEEYEIWMIMELLKNLSEDINNSKPRIVMYDRGILDRIPWIDFHAQRKTISMKDTAVLKEFFKTDFLNKYRPITYNLITSPELSVKRKGRPGRIVNIPSIEMVNSYLDRENEFLASLSSKYNVIKTDQYQGEIKRFIIDISEMVTNDILEIMKEHNYGEVCEGEEQNKIENTGTER